MHVLNTVSKLDKITYGHTDDKSKWPCISTLLYLLWQRSVHYQSLMQVFG